VVSIAASSPHPDPSISCIHTTCTAATASAGHLYKGIFIIFQLHWSPYSGVVWLLSITRHATTTAVTGAWPVFGSWISRSCHKILRLVPLLIFATLVAAVPSSNVRRRHNACGWCWLQTKQPFNSIITIFLGRRKYYIRRIK
jgi:hypothetical protein